MNIQYNISLKPYNTFNIDVIAKQFATFQSVDELKSIIEEPSFKQQPSLLILGGGSNILFTKDYDGIVLKNNLKGIELVKEDADFFYVKAFGGEVWHEFVLFCINHNYAGIENLSLIPGSVGASPLQNIGAYGVEIKDVFHELEAYHLLDHSIQTFSLNDCQFGYRESVFKKKYKEQFLVLNVTYKLRKQPVFNTSYGAIEQELEKMNAKELSIQTISQAVIQIRSSKLPDPAQIGNAGSFFKNPQILQTQLLQLKQLYPNIPSYIINEEYCKVPAGWLIEQCGWKGYRKDDAGCHARQALVLVKYGNTTGTEILQLSEEIIQSVQTKFGIELEREVNIV